MNQTLFSSAQYSPALRRILFLLAGSILIALALLPTAANSASVWSRTDKNCKVWDIAESSNHTWSGACMGGFAEGEGVLRYKACADNQCIFMSEVAVMRRGIKTGMTVAFTADSPTATSKAITVMYRDAQGDDVESVAAYKRSPPEIPAGKRGLTYYLLVTDPVVKAANLPGVASGLSLGEVLALWEAWHSNVNYQAPSHYDGPTVESSRTVEWYKQRDEYRRTLDQSDTERAARRQAAREERERDAAAAQQRIAALQRAAGVQPTQQSSGASPSANSTIQPTPAVAAQAPSLAAPAPLTPAEYQRPGSGTDNRIWLETANIQRCGEYAATPRKQGDTAQWFTITNTCSMAIKVHMSLNSDTSRFSSLAELAPGKVERSWWLITTRPEMAFFVCPASGPSGEDVYPDEPQRRCFYRRR